MSTRFEILKNGQRLCISGINGDGVLSVCVTYVKQADSELSHDLQIFGLGMFGGSNDRHRHAAWTSPQITVGDEISIRILPPGEFDEPSGMTGTLRKLLTTLNWDHSISVPVLGTSTSRSMPRHSNPRTSIYPRMKMVQQLNSG